MTAEAVFVEDRPDILSELLIQGAIVGCLPELGRSTAGGDLRARDREEGDAADQQGALRVQGSDRSESKRGDVKGPLPIWRRDRLHTMSRAARSADEAHGMRDPEGETIAPDGRTTSVAICLSLA